MNYMCFPPIKSVVLFFLHRQLQILQWIESEKMRLGHLRDRASDMGHRKEYPFSYIYY
jgi:hypothetical protein